MSSKRLCAVVAISLLLGAVGGWWFQSVSVARDFKRLRFVHEIEVAGLCSAWLTATRDGDLAKADRLGLARLESAVETAYRLTGDDTTPLPEYLPNIRESMRRSAEYLATSDNRLAGWATELSDRL